MVNSHLHTTQLSVKNTAVQVPDSDIIFLRLKKSILNGGQWPLLFKA